MSSLNEVVKKQALVISQKNQVSLQIWGRAFYHIFSGNIRAKLYCITEGKNDKGEPENVNYRKCLLCSFFKVLESMFREERNKVTLLEFERGLLLSR